jgi:hypothetical protein
MSCTRPCTGFVRSGPASAPGRLAIGRGSLGGPLSDGCEARGSISRSDLRDGVGSISGIALLFQGIRDV